MNFLCAIPVRNALFLVKIPSNLEYMFNVISAPMDLLPYKFVSLSPEQIQDRRDKLDQYGFYAYLSPIVLLISIFFIRIILSSSVKDSKNPRDFQKPSTLQLQWRRLVWWLDEPLTPEFGQTKVHLLGLAYASWLLFLSFYQTGNDYLHLTKRLGHVAISQLPLEYAMAIKSTRNPIQIAAGLSWEALNPYHRLFGRIVHLFLIAHAAMYMNFFIAAGLLSKRIQDTDVRLGLAAFWVFNILAVTALPPVRKSGYHTRFYLPHIMTAFILLPILAFHVPYTRKYIYQALAAYVITGLARNSSTTDAPILSSVMPIEGTNLIKLCAPGPAWGIPPLMGKSTPGWIPGQHVYVKRSVSPKEPRNPFTIVSLPPREGQDGGFESSYIDLIIQNSGGPTTGWLSDKPKETKRLDRNAHVLIEGPYGQAQHYVPRLLSSKGCGTVLLVAGGVGAAYTLPIYLSLLANKDSLLKAKFIWFVRSVEETKWVTEMVVQAKLSNIDAQIYITRAAAKTVDEKASNDFGASKVNGLQVLPGTKRPDMKDIVESVFRTPQKSRSAHGNGNNQEPVTVLSCGPEGMTKHLRREVGKYVYRDGRDVRWHEEQFGHGDS